MRQNSIRVSTREGYSRKIEPVVSKMAGLLAGFLYLLAGYTYMMPDYYYYYRQKYHDVSGM